MANTKRMFNAEDKFWKYRYETNSTSVTFSKIWDRSEQEMRSSAFFLHGVSVAAGVS